MMLATALSEDRTARSDGSKLCAKAPNAKSLARTARVAASRIAARDSRSTLSRDESPPRPFPFEVAPKRKDGIPRLCAPKVPMAFDSDHVDHRGFRRLANTTRPAKPGWQGDAMNESLSGRTSVDNTLVTTLSFFLRDVAFLSQLRSCCDSRKTAFWCARAADFTKY